MNKKCTFCNILQSINNFSWDRPNQRKSKCRKCCLILSYKWRKKYPEKVKKWRKISSKKLKIEVFNQYGIICQCCGESKIEFLCIDHINNNGNKHRKKIKTQAGIHFYEWLKKNYYPKGFQVLCYNCNIAKYHNNGRCPHKVII